MKFTILVAERAVLVKTYEIVLEQEQLTERAAYELIDAGKAKLVSDERESIYLPDWQVDEVIATKEKERFCPQLAKLPCPYCGMVFQYREANVDNIARKCPYCNQTIVWVCLQGRFEEAHWKKPRRKNYENE